MLKAIGISFILLLSVDSIGQQSFWEDSDSLSKKRVIGITATAGSIWSGTMIGLSQVWYKDVEKTKWHPFNDCQNWLQMDKAGHFYTANKIANLTGNMYRWAGASNNQQAWIGFGYSLGYQMTLEMLDAYSAEWGFSWCDAGANLVGSASYLGQQLLWKEQKITPKFSYSHSPYAALRPEILGVSFPERLLKDYNGQTYWLSVSLGSFLKESKIPEWLCFSVGYSVDAKLIGDNEYFEYSSNNQLIQLHSSRQYLFSFDIDFSKLPIKRPWLKVIVNQLNYLKIPFPALHLQNGNLSAKGFYF